jgi:glycosyltransferase involved in cell wall biosynthesis
VAAQPVVEAVIVNHNTSLFAELAVRSLVASVEQGEPASDLRITVVDNHSTDDVAALQEVIHETGATFERSRWPVSETAFNSHGDVLRDFVLARPDADFFLFVDSDIDFESPAAVQTMLAELDDDRSLWAVQARFVWPEENQGEGASLDIWAGRSFEARVSDVGWDPDALTPVSGAIHRRCHPGATLVRATPLFRAVAERIGFSSLVVVGGDPDVAGFYDTFGMASAFLGVSGYEYALSDVRVHHFFMASYDKVHVEAREVDCRQRLSRFTTRRG